VLHNEDVSFSGIRVLICFIQVLEAARQEALIAERSGLENPTFPPTRSLWADALPKRTTRGEKGGCLLSG